LGVLPEWYIYSKAERVIRDLLRRRVHVVHQHTANVLSVQNIMVRNTGARFSGRVYDQRARDSVFPEEDQRLPLDGAQVKKLQYILFLNEYRDDAPVQLENQKVALTRFGPRDIESKEKFDFIARRYFNVPPFEAACLDLDFALQKGQLVLSIDFTVGHGKACPFPPLGSFSNPARSLKGKLVMPEARRASWTSNRVLSFITRLQTNLS
jgi:hypothetical protein